MQLRTARPENYDVKDISEIKNVSKALSTDIEKIGEVAPSDRSFKAGEIRTAKRRMLEDFNKAKDEKYSRLLAEQTQALFQPSTDVKEIAGAQELRDSFKQFAGDGPLITMFVSKLTDQQFDVLRFAQPTPIVRKDSAGIVTSVETRADGSYRYRESRIIKAETSNRRTFTDIRGSQADFPRFEQGHSLLLLIKKLEAY